MPLNAQSSESLSSKSSYKSWKLSIDSILSKTDKAVSGISASTNPSRYVRSCMEYKYLAEATEGSDYATMNYESLGAFSIDLLVSLAADFPTLRLDWKNLQPNWLNFGIENAPSCDCLKFP